MTCTNFNTSLNLQAFVSDYFDLTDNYRSGDVLLITFSFCEMKSDLKSRITQQEDRLYYKAQYDSSLSTYRNSHNDHSHVLLTIEENNLSEI